MPNCNGCKASPAMDGKWVTMFACEQGKEVKEYWCCNCRSRLGLMADADQTIPTLDHNASKKEIDRWLIDDLKRSSGH